MSTGVSPLAADTLEEYVSVTSSPEPPCGNTVAVALTAALIVTEAAFVTVKVLVADSPAYRDTSNEAGETESGSATVRLTWNGPSETVA